MAKTQREGEQCSTCRNWEISQGGACQHHRVKNGGVYRALITDPLDWCTKYKPGVPHFQRDKERNRLPINPLAK